MFIEIKNDSEINEDVILNSKDISVIFLKKNSLHHTIRYVTNWSGFINKCIFSHKCCKTGETKSVSSGNVQYRNIIPCRCVMFG